MSHQHEFDRAAAIGARFALSPGATPALLEAAAAGNLPYVPGIATVSELMIALALGFDIVKLFPAVPLGGLATMKALAAPSPPGALLLHGRHRRS